MEAEVCFFSNEKKVQTPIIIKCKSDDKMSSIFKAFTKELESEVNDYEFRYRGNEINDYNSTIISLKKNKQANEIDIYFLKKSKILWMLSWR